jgi:hypothetical protein
VGISRNYPLKTRTSKQLIGKIPGFEIILSHPVRYPRSKQGLSAEVRGGREAARTGFLQVGGPAGGDTDVLLTCTPANRASIRFWRGVGAEEGQGIDGESVYVSTEEQIW